MPHQYGPLSHRERGPFILHTPLRKSLSQCQRTKINSAPGVTLHHPKSLPLPSASQVSACTPRLTERLLAQTMSSNAPGGELYGSCTLQNQCDAARRPQISLGGGGFFYFLKNLFILLQKGAASPPGRRKRKPRHMAGASLVFLWFGNYSLPSLVRQLRQTYLSS